MYTAESGSTYYTAQDVLESIEHTSCDTEEESGGSEALEELLNLMNEKDKEDNVKDENARQSDCSETSDDQDVREMPEDELTLNAADVDCIVLPMEVSELLNNFPSWQMACLINYPVFIKGLHEVICVADFGYKVLINMVTSEQKKNIVKRLYALGIMVIPHHSRYILTTSRMSVGLHVLARGLMGGGLRLVYLAVYGMKIPLYEVRFYIL